MNHFIYFMFLLLLFIVIINSGLTADKKNIPTSPFGPYRIVFKQIYNCEIKQNNKIQFNDYINHSRNSTWLLGNHTFKVPLDNTLFLEMRLALKDSLGRWKENLFVYKSPNACSTLKQLMGNAWTAFKLGFGLPNTDCPICPGTYTAPGFDPSILKDSNVPKAFVYGTYKFHMYFTKQNEVFGCQIYIMEFKRP